jgi:NAD(P)-dependent dehydrogenase (short-subunit alcohol dehydrogenase family)
MTRSGTVAGKRALVTAAADGIGKVIATALMNEGAEVHICDVDAARLRAFSAERPGLGTTLADVSSEEQVDQLFEEVTAHLGGLDILVNNAGIGGPAGRLETLEYASWRRTIEVNLDGTFLCCRRAVPLLKEAGGGAIINISSTAGLFGYPRRSPYASAKWAIIGLTKTLAMELGPFGIQANAICPGSVAGDRIERVIRVTAENRGVSEDEVRNDYLRHTSMKTFVEAEDVASTILFLCSDAGARISGQALAVDGHTEGLSEH